MFTHGLIPAHAGKMALRHRHRPRPEAHPRSRGENTSVKPRSRIAWWLIPAHAGKISSACGAAWSARAHPRSRGENTRRPVFRSPAKGSSPLTRGKFDEVDGREHVDGLIPAHAGKMRPQHPRRWPTGAHPRSRGENRVAGPPWVGQLGSSPLTRGKFTRPTPSQFKRGLIPAHAGKIPTSAPDRPSRRAHPRSRGENEGPRAEDQAVAGSSPLTRGKWLVLRHIG